MTIPDYNKLDGKITNSLINTWKSCVQDDYLKKREEILENSDLTEEEKNDYINTYYYVCIICKQLIDNPDHSFDIILADDYIRINDDVYSVGRYNQSLLEIILKEKDLLLNTIYDSEFKLIKISDKTR